MFKNVIPEPGSFESGVILATGFSKSMKLRRFWTIPENNIQFTLVHSNLKIHSDIIIERYFT